MNNNFTTNDQDVIKAELDHIAASRKRHKISGNDYSAFAISGGGIRSAAFGLGVMQALVSAGVLNKIDYLSTVSGGGYIGSSLTWFLKKGLPPGGTAGTDASNFPLGQPRTGARLSDKRDEVSPNSALDFIRQHGHYLTPTKLLGFASLVATALRTSLVSLIAYFLLAATAMILIIPLGLFEPVFVADLPLPALLPAVLATNGFLIAAFTLALLFAALSVLYSLRTRLGPANYFGRTNVQIAQGIMLQLTIWFTFLGVLPFVEGWLTTLRMAVEAAGVTAVLGAIMGYWQQRRQQQQQSASPLIGMIGAVLLIYGLVFGAYLFARAVTDAGNVPWIAVAAAALVMGLVVNTNYLSLHRGYRDRLMETFMPDMESVEKNRWGRATEADKALIEDMCREPNERPYHLIGANVVLINSPTSKYRGRGGDCFLFSPLYCGSNATGWIRSNSYMKRGGRGITLSTAMAVSGASFNPNSGNSGRGLTHNRLVSTVFSLLNIRLGYWAANPNRKRSRWIQPNFIYPGLKGGIFGGAFREERRVIEITDGGHFDNTAMYELIRRKVRLIILSDAGADPEFKFDDIGNLIERVRVDFGVKIRFDDDQYRPQYLIPGTARGDDPLIERYGLAQNAFAIGRIEYPDKTEGALVYVKATLVANLPTDLYSYKAANHSFPHEPTSDQFFDEVQFESYRELGYQLTWQMIEAVRDREFAETTTPSRALAAGFM